MRLTFPLLLGLMTAPALAQTTVTTQSTLSKVGLEKTISQLSSDPVANGFQIGMLQTLRAVEKTLQIRYKYGIGDRITNLPLLRLEFEGLKNPAPEKSTPDTLSKLVDGFVADMDQARTTLANAEGAGIVPFELSLQDIWFDVNANGIHEKSESAVAILGPSILGRRNYRDFTKSNTDIVLPTIKFDEADHAWLIAYTNMLSGFGNLFMAFDPAPVLRDLAEERASLASAPTIPNIYDLDAVRAEIVALEAEQKEIQELQEAISEQLSPLEKELRELEQAKRAANDEANRAIIQGDMDRLSLKIKPLSDERRSIWQSLRFIRSEIRSAKLKLPDGGGTRSRSLRNQQTSIDAIYVIFKSLEQEPDPARIQAAYDGWRAMIRHNRIFWERLGAETDNDHEWIPNPSQESTMPFDIPPRLAAGWQAVLQDIESTLKGDLLLNHPLLPDGYGISVPAYVADPTPLDLIGWIHGVDAYKYAAKGPRLSGQSWQAFRRITSGNAGGFALFLN